MNRQSVHNPENGQSCPNRLSRGNHPETRNPSGLKTAGCEVFILFENTIYHCGQEHRARVYNLPTKRGRWKKLFFLDECPFCYHTVATIWECSKEGMLKRLTYKLDKEAIKLRDKMASFAFKDFKEKKGSYSNEIILYNNKGNIFNFNNYKVGTNEDFCSKTLVEING